MPRDKQGVTGEADLPSLPGMPVNEAVARDGVSSGLTRRRSGVLGSASRNFLRQSCYGRCRKTRILRYRTVWTKGRSLSRWNVLGIRISLFIRARHIHSGGRLFITRCNPILRIPYPFGNLLILF